jgi:penicillin-binding protein 1C
MRLKEHFVKYKFRYSVLAGIFLVFLVVDRILPPLKPESFSPVVLDRDGKMLSAYLNEEDIWRIKTNKNEVSPYFLKAILQKEDKYFYYHPGVNLVAIVKAVFNNTFKSERRTGASTITMQVVRMQQPKKRTYLAKLTEILRAVQLELHYSKDEILEMYLNLIPYGSNIEGIKTASLIYLNKHPSRLSLAEAVMLSIIPNKPNLLKAGKITPELNSFNVKWLNFYGRKGIFSKAEVEIAQSEKVALKRRTLPRNAPHFSLMLSQNSKAPYINSTVVLGVQRSVEQSVRSHLEKVRQLGLQNAMAMVIDNQTMEVIAYVGSAEFDDKKDGGQVDGIQAVRSPGSTLKPFLYGKAIEAGLLSSKTVMYDIPTDFAGFTPTNFSNNFQGQVTMREALQQSLNIPAVEILHEYGVRNFIEDLKKTGFSSIKQNEDQLGLSLILGGCGVKMNEMVSLYAAMANYGNLQTIKYTKSDTRRSAVAVLDSSAAYIIANVLSGIQRPDFPNNFDFTYKLPKIAWKTGTSFGKRDAWAIGYNPNYTIGVWLGNFSGVGVPQLSGAEVATPLLFSLFNQIDKKSGWYTIPSGLIIKEVCSVSGLPRNSFCDSFQYDEFISGTHFKKKCNHLKPTWVNPQRTFSYCNRCLDKLVAVREMFPDYPPRYLEFLQNSGLPYPKIPPHNPSCSVQKSLGELSILSPRQGGVYYVQGNEELELKAQASSTDEQLIWYHNNRLVGSISGKKTLFIKPEIGQNTVSCTDQSGKTVSVVFEVKGF